MEFLVLRRIFHITVVIFLIACNNLKEEAVIEKKEQRIKYLASFVDENGCQLYRPKLDNGVGIVQTVLYYKNKYNNSFVKTKLAADKCVLAGN